MTGIPPGLTLPAEVLGAAGKYDYADHFAVESGKEIRQFMADFFSFRPMWLKGLYRLRRPLARILGIEHSLEAVRQFRQQDIPFTPGQRMWIFEVAAAREGEYWAAVADDVHLRAVLAVIREIGAGGLPTYRVMTFVRYKNWRGPVYFTLIRPFHALVVKAMAEAAR